MIKIPQRVFFIGVFSLFVCVGALRAQEITDINNWGIEEYTNLSLPPLDVLFENAKSAPSYELAAVEEEVERRLLKKEKRSFLSFFSIRGSWQYGNYSNDGTFSDVSTPIFYTYSKAEQTSYSVGAAINIPLETLFDLGPKVKRQKLQVRAAELRKEIGFEGIQKEIIQLYSAAMTQLNILKFRAESVVLANTQYAIVEKNFINGTTGTDVLATEKEKQSISMERYETTKSELNKTLMILEIITGTPILRK